jgi:hypothetical protein
MRVVSTGLAKEMFGESAIRIGGVTVRSPLTKIGLLLTLIPLVPRERVLSIHDPSVSRPFA